MLYDFVTEFTTAKDGFSELTLSFRKCFTRDQRYKVIQTVYVRFTSK